MSKEMSVDADIAAGRAASLESDFWAGWVLGPAVLDAMAVQIPLPLTLPCKTPPKG